MDIDMTALRMVETERGIPLATLLNAIEEALLVAYHRQPGAIEQARAEIDRRTGEVRIHATELDEDGTPIGEFDDTPSGFGRIATATARSVIMQRLRDAEDMQVLGAYRGKAGDTIAGVIQADRSTRNVRVDVGDLEAVLPVHEQVPGSTTGTGSASAATSSTSRGAPRARRSRSRAPTPTSCGDCSPSRCRRWRTGRSRSPRSPARRATGPRWRCGPPSPGSTPRAPASARWASGSVR